jgi:hypothetical protein
MIKNKKWKKNKKLRKINYFFYKKREKIEIKQKKWEKNNKIFNY